MDNCPYCAAFASALSWILAEENLRNMLLDKLIETAKRPEVQAILQSNKPRAVKALVARAGLEEKYAVRAYDLLIDGWREDGRLATDDGMSKFFDMAIASGDVDAPWAKEKYWDNRFMATIDEWKPK